MASARIPYHHVDVFSRKPLSGNGLTVFPESTGLSPAAMQRITQEMRQFESIFLAPTDRPDIVSARIFTMEEELAFAGHPVLGAACVLHEQRGADLERAEWRFELSGRTVPVISQRHAGWYSATMEQGPASFGEPIARENSSSLLAALDLEEGDLAEGLPLQVVSTGLPYLIVPLASGLERARIVRSGFESLLAEVGAKFVYVLDVAAREGRTWDNDGRVEDVATGSAAGPTGAYLVHHGVASAGDEIVLHQGRLVGRPSEIRVRIAGTAANVSSVQVGGEVSMVGRGVLDLVTEEPAEVSP